ncbi:hypothetical protein YM3MPS_53290 [Mycobacterium pseudoshottsii]|uniref:Uncharacterized protein n=1 Tax=Mycobacterium pseudoshottsii TaxID=265949 RepID=A0A9N7LUI6_9MYCO|nr:hypothetical protein MPSD_54150 [Mycobacterium pseudoshottsii JCM 15466]BDN85151.1 hypothetical protein NJB1907Z4_C53660 [Mycobacterium pseudoshottsii]BEH79526.1 hypothetical protein YM3MPS_53290 [Mycobacterium pseudoshottsii]
MPADATGAGTHAPSTTHTTGATRTPQPATTAPGPTRPAGHTRSTDATGTTHATGADKTRGTTGSTVGSGRPRPTISAVAPQDPAGPTGLPSARDPINSITDQRTAEQRHTRRIDHPQRLLFELLQRPHIQRLGLPIGAPARGQRPHEVVVEQRHPSTHRLVLPTETTKQFRNRGRHLITGSRQHPHRGTGRRQIGLPKPRTQTRQIPSSRLQQTRTHRNKRHHTTPLR